MYRVREQASGNKDSGSNRERQKRKIPVDTALGHSANSRHRRKQHPFKKENLVN